MVTGAVLAGIAARGWFDSSTKTVTAQEAPIILGKASQETRGLPTHEIYERDAPGVVSVSATGIDEAPSAAEVIKGEGGERGTATGSGFEINGTGMILTNWHVVENAAKVAVSFGENGKTVEARVVGEDPSDDVAVLPSARARDSSSQRRRNQQCPADRHSDQSRQLRWAAAKRIRAGDRYQLADRHVGWQWRQRRYRLCDPDRHGQEGASNARKRRDGGQ